MDKKETRKVPSDSESKELIDAENEMFFDPEKGTFYVPDEKDLIDLEMGDIADLEKEPIEKPVTSKIVETSEDKEEKVSSIGHYLIIGSIISYILSLIFIGLGFYKILVYENPDSYLLDSKNAYVGGDSYNYIINANYATGYFTLAVFCAVIGMTFIISHLLLKNKSTIQ